MAKSAIITLTTAGTNTGPFNLLSDVDSYVSPFESNISKASLVAGYTTNLVPDAATIIRVKSSGSCTNFIDLTYPTITTTTTSTTTTTTTTALVQIDWITGPKGAGAGILEIRDASGTQILNEVTTPGTKSGSLFINQSATPYSVTGSWSAGSGNIVRYNICDITNGGEIFYSGDIDNITGSVSYQVSPTPLHSQVWLTSGASDYPPTCPP